MTTPTDRAVSRVTILEYKSANLGQKPRKIVITINGDTLTLRQQRCKQREQIDISEVMEIARWRRLKDTMPKVSSKRRKK